MIKMILVDDDPHVLEGYKRKIDWNSLSIDVVATAMDGKEALGQIIDLGPEIVMTDIKMPIMDGIELIKEIDRLGLKTHVIIQSGYEEFDFAKQAIKYNAVAYLLKPTSKEEIVEVIKEVIDKIEKEQISKVHLKENQQRIDENDLVALLMKPKNDQLLADKIQMCFPEVESTASVIAVFLMSTNQSIMDIVTIGKFNAFDGVLSHRWDEHSWLFLFFMNEHLSSDTHYKKVLWEMVDLRNQEGLKDIRIAIGPSIVGLDRTSTTLSCAMELIEMKALTKSDEIIKTDEAIIKGKEIIGDTSAIEEAINHQVEDEVINEFRVFINYVINSNHLSKAYYEQVMASIFRVLLLLLKYPGKRENLPNEFELWENLVNCDSIEDLEYKIMSLVKAIFDANTSYNEQSLSKPIQYVVQFVNKHYMDTILLKDLSKKLYISENYLTTLFKKEMSLTFKKYLTKIRMEKAKDLLSDPSLKVRDVAKFVGYGNDDYFSKIFRQTTGLAPSDYRETINYRIN